MYRTGLVAALLWLLTALSAQAQSELDTRQSYIYGIPDSPTDAWRLSYGGRLYDNWWLVLEQGPPETPHPAYPSVQSSNPAATWRCVTCHGWDYAGSSGATVGVRGMPSLFDFSGADPERVASVLRDEVHGYGPEMIPDSALRELAFFVTSGLIDMDGYIDPNTGVPSGDADKGREIYQNVCAACHNFSGDAAIYGEADDLRTLGAIADANPWQALHKIRNGQPGADMLAMRVFDDALVADVIAYIRTLPHSAAE